MVSAHLVDAIRDPSRVIMDLYDQGRNAGVEFPAQVASHFASVFQTQDAVQQIPPLSLNYPPDIHPDRALVRFHAMVQDISPPEIYLSRLPDGRCGGWNLYQDQVTPTPVDIDFRDLRECSIFWAITVPGESRWQAKQSEEPLFSRVPETPSRTPHLTNRRHKLPNPQSPDFGVLLKIYDQGLIKDLRLMTVTTFVGILAFESIASEAETEAVTLPVLHVTFLRAPTPVIPLGPHGSALAATYERLVDWVSEEALAGDRDAAELIIVCSVAKVQSRHPPVLPLSLQLTSFPSPKSEVSTPALHYVLSKLLPLFSTVQLSLENLNNDRFTPESSGEDLSSGYLQVPAGSVMLLTEAGVQEGNIMEKGLRSLKDVQDTMSNQQLRCAFPFSQLSFNTEIGFILLVEGKQSPFFTTDILLPLQPRNKDTSLLYKSESEIDMPHQDEIDAFRSLLTGARRRERLGVPKRLAELIENDFVEERKRDKSVTQHDLTTKITIARLLGLLFQTDELTIELWERARELEIRRRRRSQE